MTRKWNIANDNSTTHYDAGNEIIYNTEFLKSNLWDSIDAYILVRGNITVTTTPAAQAALVMIMCSLIEYSSSYSEAAGRLWFYSNNEATNFK